MPYLRGSWYSQLPAFGWVDPEDRPGSAAFRPLGKPIPDSQQGIALPSRNTLGKWFNVTPPGSNLPYPMQQTDIGPAKWTGRGVDISAAGAHQMGYTPKNFPTDAAWKVEPRDEPRGLGSPAGLPVQAGDTPDNTDDVAVASGPSAPQGRKMPGSLLDMFQPQDAAGQPTDFGGALRANTNAMVGMGMGLLQPRSLAHGAPVSSAWSDALQGYQTGSALDQRRGYQQGQLQHLKAQEARQAAQDAFQRSQAAQSQSNWEKQFSREPEVLRTMRATGVDPASPEGRALLYPKTDEWKEGKVTYREQDYPYRANLRTGQYEWGPMGAPPGQGAGGGGTPSSSGQPPAVGAPSAVPAPLSGMDQELPSVQKAIRIKQLEEAAKHATKDPQQEAAAKQAAGNVLTALDTAEKLAANKAGLLPTTGIVGGALQNVYQPAKDLALTLETVKANVSLDKLSAMRAASTTGASGLGAVTESEHKLLQSSIAALDQSQSPEQFKANLARVRATYEWIVNRTDANQPPPFAMQSSAKPAPAGGAGAAGGRTFIRDPSGKIVPQ